MSILARLPSIADQQGIDYDTIVFRYLVERTLFRLGHAHPDAFVLKGGLYMGLLAYAPYRATKDADLTAFGAWTEGRLLEVFEGFKGKNPCPADEVSYSGKVRVQPISKGQQTS